MYSHKGKAKRSGEGRPGEREQKDERVNGKGGGSHWRERKRDRQRDCARDIKVERRRGWEMGRTREIRYRLQPADKSKVIGLSGILPSRTTESTVSSRYVATTYVHMHQDRERVARMTGYVLAARWLCVSRRCNSRIYTVGQKYQATWLIPATSYRADGPTLIS